MSAVLRRGAAVVVAVLIAAAFFASRYVEDLQVCQTTPPKKKDEISQTVCKPIPVTDLAPALLLVLILIWPDLSEVDIRGLGRIVRRLDETTETQRDIVGAQQQLLAQITQVRQTSTQTVAVTLPESAALARQVDDLRTELQALKGSQPALEGVDQRRLTETETPPGREGLRTELLDRWRQLEPWAEFGRRLQDDSFAASAQDVMSDPRAGSSSTRRLLARVQAAAGREVAIPDVEDWYARWQPQIEIIRRTINELDELPDSTLADALVLSRRAMDDLRRRGLAAPA